MKNPHFINFTMQHGIQPRDTAEDILSRCGRNTGNLLFVETLHRVVQHEHFEPVMSFLPRQVIAQGHDGFIIPAANWLNPTSDWGELARRIELTQLPCVMVGIGVQSPKLGAIPQITPGTLRLMQVVSERSKSIAVRGQFTAEVLEHYGIKNSAVTGCPSLLWHVDRPACVNATGTVGNKVSVGASRENNIKAVQDSSLRSRISRYLSKLALDHDYEFVAQTEIHDINASRGTFESADARKQALEYLRAAYEEDNADKLIQYLAQNLRVFSDASSWIAHMGKQRLVLGTRLHGVIAGLLAGTPSVLISHDARTIEMAKHLNIPCLAAETVLDNGLGATAISEQFEAEAFNKRMISYYREFKSFFQANDVQVNLNTIE